MLEGARYAVNWHGTIEPTFCQLEYVAAFGEPCEDAFPAPEQEESGDEEKTPGAVLRCLTEAIGETHVACAEETVRAVHSALQFYQPVRTRMQNPGPWVANLACDALSCVSNYQTYLGVQRSCGT